MTMPSRQGTAEWREARRATIGSSDIPVIVGESPYKSAYTLAAEKLGLVSDDVDAETRELMDIGHLMQPVLMQLYSLKSGRRARLNFGWKHHPDLPWATASLDGTAPVRRIVEAKWSHGKRWRSGERVPGDVLAQVQWQLFVTGWDVADVIVLDYVTPRVEEVQRDDKMIDDLLYFAKDFRGYLERGELPGVDGSESTRRTLAARYPRDNGVLVPATPDLAVMVDQLGEARARKAAAEKDEKTVGNALRAVLGEASGIEGLLSAKKNADSIRVLWPQVASAYRTLLEERGEDTERLDTLQSLHSATSEGPRVLRLLNGKDAAA